MDAGALAPTLRMRRGSSLRSRAMRGDPDAFAALYELHHQALYRYCRSIVHHDEDARDALQSTMAKAFAALQTEQRDFELRPWLFRIAHNEAISLIRRRPGTAELHEELDAGRDTLQQTVETRERLAQLRVDLQDLPEEQRAALVMRELSGLGHDEIAAALGRSPRAVKQTIYEARSNLHQCAEGRAMACGDVQRTLSDGDGRLTGSRRMRAHLRSCRSCQQFRVALGRRPADLAALAPGLPLAIAASIFTVAKGTAGATATGGGLTAVSGSVVGAGGGLALTGAAKIAVLAATVATVAGGTVAVTKPAPEAVRVAPPAHRAPAPAGPRTMPVALRSRPAGAAGTTGDERRSAAEAARATGRDPRAVATTAGAPPAPSRRPSPARSPAAGPAPTAARPGAAEPGTRPGQAARPSVGRPASGPATGGRPTGATASDGRRPAALPAVATTAPAPGDRRTTAPAPARPTTSPAPAAAGAASAAAGGATRSTPAPPTAIAGAAASQGHGGRP